MSRLTPEELRRLRLRLGMPLVTPEELVALRLQTRLTQRDMAQLMGIWANTLSRYECGKLPIPDSIGMLARCIAQRRRRR